MGIDEVKQLADAAGEAARNVIAQERDPLLIMTLFGRGAPGIRRAPVNPRRPSRQRRRLHRPGDRQRGPKYRWAALSTSLVARLHQFCYKWEIPRQGRIFPMTK